MKDPYLQDHERYLNSLNRFKAPTRPNFIQAPGTKAKSHTGLWVFALLIVVLSTVTVSVEEDAVPFILTKNDQ